MSAYPTPVSAIDVKVGSASVLAIEGVDGGAWLSGTPAQQQQFCAMEMRSGGCDAFDITPFDGCVAITDDGGCSYETKAANAAAAGATLCVFIQLLLMQVQALLAYWLSRWTQCFR
jgi:hypothetical protein